MSGGSFNSRSYIASGPLTQAGSKRGNCDGLDRLDFWAEKESVTRELVRELLAQCHPPTPAAKGLVFRSPR
jgi:hypothetical protein